VNVVTGVFSYTGGYIARELLQRGEPVKTLSRAPAPGHPLSREVAFGRLSFDDPVALQAELRGASTLYNTYWIRPRVVKRLSRQPSQTRACCSMPPGVQGCCELSTSE